MARGDSRNLDILVLAAVVIAAVGFSVSSSTGRPALRHRIQRHRLESARRDLGPSLCGADPSNSGCKSGHVGEMGRTFVLHGLWPQPSSDQYCDVPKDVADGARSSGLRHAVGGTLGGRRQLHRRCPTRRSWHRTSGTRTARVPASHRTSTSAMRDAHRAGSQGSRSPVQEATRAAGTLSTVRDQFDAEFGAGAGERVALTCRNVTGEGSVAYEVQLSLTAGRRAENRRTARCR